MRAEDMHFVGLSFLHLPFPFHRNVALLCALCYCIVPVDDCLISAFCVPLCERVVVAFSSTFISLCCFAAVFGIHFAVSPIMLRFCLRSALAIVFLTIVSAIAHSVVFRCPTFGTALILGFQP